MLEECEREPLGRAQFGVVAARERTIVGRCNGRGCYASPSTTDLLKGRVCGSLFLGKGRIKTQ